MIDLPKGPTATELHARAVCAHKYWLSASGLRCTKCAEPYVFPPRAAA